MLHGSRVLAGALAAAASCALQAAEPYPVRPILLVVPFPPGGVVELVGRPLAASMEKFLKQPVVISNKPGAAGAVGNAFVASAEPDGYKLLMSLSSISVIPEADKLFNRKPAYTLEQLLPIARVSADPTVLVVQSSAPWKSIKELVDDAKARPAQISFSSSGIYGALHVPAEMLALAAGTKFRHVPFSGGGPATTALLGGHVQFSVQGPSAVAGHVKANRMRLLAHWGGRKLDLFPELPSLKELGYDVEYYIWSGMFAPAKTPPAIVNTLRKAVADAVADADFRNAMDKISTPIQYLDQPEFTRFFAADGKRLAAAVRKIGRVEEKK
ncbi:MAG: tripartite tricarboxylate transporter substrate binding protein [Burkholderiales bacterium]|nr:tripartite tricarboxylate transporter substrate binding protein [Burkholderiales bacterium]